MDMNAHFGRRTEKSAGLYVYPDEPLWHCLVCGCKISQAMFKDLNGVCISCPKPTTIAPQFWAVISKRAAMGDQDAQETFEKYG